MFRVRIIHPVHKYRCWVVARGYNDAVRIRKQFGGRIVGKRKVQR